MERALKLILTLAWALWFGGTIALFVFVITLFRQGLGAQAAPVLFVSFGTYQSILAVIALITAFAGWLVGRRSWWRMALFVSLALAAIAATTVTVRILPRMEALRAEGRSASEEFRALHKRSERLYSAQAMLLLASGVLIVLDPNRKTTRVREADQASARTAA